MGIGLAVGLNWASMVLTLGARVGPYEVGALIGRGGMGEVYRAKDTKLNRDVALKILPEALTHDPDRMARFEREAKVLASLNHPNIGAIYGLEESAGILILVLELIQGPTLADRLARATIPLDEALEIAIQITEAIEVAHEQGIVHRDLKPANIKVREDGQVKVLDFGLARVATLRTAQADFSHLPTVPSDSTQGIILGTPAYMSPEQASGKPVDNRTDIWAFGCVLYEMLAGCAAFSEGTAAETIASILKHEPKWQKLPAATPAEVRRLLQRCLRKDPWLRLHHIADARIELEDARAVPSALPLPTRRWQNVVHWPFWLGMVAGGLMLAALFSLFLGSPEPSSSTARVNRLTDLAGLEEAPAVSPDGRSVAFTGSVGDTRQIFVQLLARGAPLQLTRDPGDHQAPRWSPDSSSIVYFLPAGPGESEGALWEIPALGGQPRRLANALGGADFRFADSRLAFFRLADDRIQLVTVKADGSSLEVVGEFPPLTYYLYPRWSPDGKWIAFQRGDSIRFDLFVLPASGGELRQVTQDNAMIGGFTWLPDSSGIIYSSSRGQTMPYLPKLGLWEVRLSDGTLRQIRSGEASYVHPDVAKDGSIIVSRLRLETDIWKFPVNGEPGENVHLAARITNQTGQVLTPTGSPDDREVAFLSDSGGHANLWVINTETGAMRQITYERNPNVAVGLPVWSPDGRSIAFVYSRGNPGLTFGIWLVNPDGSNLRRLVNPGLGPAWSPDGQFLYYAARGSATAADAVMKKIPADGGVSITVSEDRLRNVIGSDGATVYYTFERPLADGRPEFEIRAASPEDSGYRALARISSSRVPIWQIVNPALSPDGKWLAQALTEGSTTNIWALSAVTGEWRKITDFGQRRTFIARRVSWSSDGRYILAAVAEGDADIVLLEGQLY